MRIVYAYLYFFLFCSPLYSMNTQPDSVAFPPISKEVQISLITGEPGKELYTSFGHSAVRVYDPITGIDLVYNYGTFDFDAPGFYSNFLKGRLNYSLSVYDFNRMAFAYRYFNQSLYEQVLNLSYNEEKAVYDFLNVNYQPENRYYPYDFFFDNCSSRIRDVFQNILGAKLVFNDDHIKKHKTFRQLLDEFLYVNPWGDFGIDLILGLPADDTVTSEEYMFLPYKLYDAFDNAVIDWNKEEIPFVKATHVIHQSVKMPGDRKISITPRILFWSLFIIILGLSLILPEKKVILKILDIFLFLSVGLAGFIIAFLWFGTDHYATKDNLNLLWAFPTHLFLVYLIIRDFRSVWIRYYHLFWMFFLILFLGSWTLLPQQLNLANIPIILMLIVRFYFNYKKLNAYVERRT